MEKYGKNYKLHTKKQMYAHIKWQERYIEELSKFVDDTEYSNKTLRKMLESKAEKQTFSTFVDKTFVYSIYGDMANIVEVEKDKLFEVAIEHAKVEMIKNIAESDFFKTKDLGNGVEMTLTVEK